MEATATPPTAVATRPTGGAVGAVEDVTGEVAGVKLLYAQIAYGVGGLHNAGFPDGSLVLDGKYVVANRKVPARIIPVKATQSWKDYFKNADFAAGLRPARYATAKEAIATGKRVQTRDKNSGWADDPTGARKPDGRPVRVGPEISMIWDLVFLLQKGMVQDKDGNEAFADGLFFVKLGDSYYCPAQISFEKQGFDPFDQTISRALALSKQEGVPIHRWLYTLRTDILPAKYAGGNSATIARVERAQDPVTKQGAVLSDGEFASLTRLLTPLQNAQAADGDPADDANP